MLILSPEAQIDIQTGYQWYKKLHQYLGKDFMMEIEAQVELIAENPSLYVKIFQNIHRALCYKFPYAIYFIMTNDNIVIIGVLHQSRSPAIWKTRMV